MSMSGERQAVCARRVGVRRQKGVGLGVAEPHEVGTDTRNDDCKINCRKACSTRSMRRLISKKAVGQGLLGIWRDNFGQTNEIPTAQAGLQCCCCSTEAQLRHNNGISQ